MRQRLAEQEFKQLLKDKTNNIEILLQEQLPQNLLIDERQRGEYIRHRKWNLHRDKKQSLGRKAAFYGIYRI